MEKESKEKSSFFGAALIPIAIVVLALSFIFSMHVGNIENDAQGFSGDISKSGFVEYLPEGGSSARRLFSESERAELDQMVKNTAQKLQINIIVYASQKEYSDFDTKSLCDNSYDSIFGMNTDGFFYYIDLSGKSPAYDYLSTSGRAILPLQSKKEVLFSNMDSYLPRSQNVAINGVAMYKNEIYRGIGYFLSAVESFYKDFYSAGARLYSFYNSRTGKYVFYTNNVLYVTSYRPPLQKFVLLLFAEALGVLAGGIFCASLKKKYRFVTKTNPTVYMKGNSVRFTEQTDTFLREHTTRTQISSSSSSGSGGRGGFSGGTHGGGGHHR